MGVSPSGLNLGDILEGSALPQVKRLNFMAAITICGDFGAPKTKV